MSTLPPTCENQHQVIVVTGLSGAGKTSVIRGLEDLGFYCVDNLPVPLLSTFLSFAFASSSNLCKVAIGIDARSRRFLKDFMREIESLNTFLVSRAMIPAKVIFLESSEAVIMKRFGETRRKHPMGRGSSMSEAIKREKDLLKPIRAAADIVLNTDTLNIHALRNWVITTFLQGKREMVVNLLSFGFKYGLPSQSDLAFDVRFLPNPYFDEHLKPLSGQDKAIQDYLFSSQTVNEYYAQLTPFLRFSLIKSFEEGRFFVTVAIGCTGGRHRSVALVEKLSLEKWPGILFMPQHRDLNNDGRLKSEKSKSAYDAASHALSSSD